MKGILKKVQGQIDGVKGYYIKKLEKLFQIAISKTQIVNIQIIDVLSEITTQINWEIAILINRKGCIEEIFIGEAG